MIVEWSKPALEDLDIIEDYIAEDDYLRAVEFVDELIQLGDSLSDEQTCRKGTPAKISDNKSLRELYYKGYTIIYEVTDEKVVIHEVYNQFRIYIRMGKR